MLSNFFVQTPFRRGTCMLRRVATALGTKVGFPGVKRFRGTPLCVRWWQSMAAPAPDRTGGQHLSVRAC